MLYSIGLFVGSWEGMLCIMCVFLSCWLGDVVLYGSACQQLGGGCCTIWDFLSAAGWGMLYSKGLFISSWMGDVVHNGSI